MGFFDSNSDATTQGTEQGTQAEDDAKATSINISAGDDQNASVTINQSTIDAGAVEDSFFFAAGVVDESYDLVSEATGQAIEFAGEVVAENTGLVEGFREDLLTFSGGAIGEANRLSELVIEQQERAREDAFTLAAGTIQSIQASSAASLSAGLRSADQAVGRIADVTGSAFGAIERGQTQAFELVGEGFSESFEFLQETSADTIDAISTAAQSETERGLDNVIELAKTAMIGIVVIGLGFAAASKLR